jgi:hypothetical protein
MCGNPIECLARLMVFFKSMPIVMGPMLPGWARA